MVFNFNVDDATSSTHLLLRSVSSTLESRNKSYYAKQIATRINLLSVGWFCSISDVFYQFCSALIKIPITLSYVVVSWIPIKKSSQGKMRFIWHAIPNELTLKSLGGHIGKIFIFAFSSLFIPVCGCVRPSLCVRALKVFKVGLPNDHHQVNHQQQHRIDPPVIVHVESTIPSEIQKEEQHPKEGQQEACDKEPSIRCDSSPQIPTGSCKIEEKVEEDNPPEVKEYPTEPQIVKKMEFNASSPLFLIKTRFFDHLKNVPLKASKRQCRPLLQLGSIASPKEKNTIMKTSKQTTSMYYKRLIELFVKSLSDENNVFLPHNMLNKTFFLSSLKSPLFFNFPKEPLDSNVNIIPVPEPTKAKNDIPPPPIPPLLFKETYPQPPQPPRNPPPSKKKMHTLKHNKKSNSPKLVNKRSLHHSGSLFSSLMDKINQTDFSKRVLFPDNEKEKENNDDNDSEWLDEELSYALQQQRCVSSSPAVIHCPVPCKTQPIDSPPLQSSPKLHSSPKNSKFSFGKRKISSRIQNITSSLFKTSPKTPPNKRKQTAQIFTTPSQRKTPVINSSVGTPSSMKLNGDLKSVLLRQRSLIDGSSPE